MIKRKAPSQNRLAAHSLAEAEGLADIFEEAGFEWRLASCSRCLAMSPDQLQPGERCAAISKRNFEGRQGCSGRTHLLSPAIAAATAITGRLTGVRNLIRDMSGSITGDLQ